LTHPLLGMKSIMHLFPSTVKQRTLMPATLKAVERPRLAKSTGLSEKVTSWPPGLRKKETDNPDSNRDRDYRMSPFSALFL